MKIVKIKNEIVAWVKRLFNHPWVSLKLTMKEMLLLLVISLSPIIATVAYSLVAKDGAPLSAASISPQRDFFSVDYISRFLRPLDIAVYVFSVLGAVWTAINNLNRPNKGVSGLYWYIIISILAAALSSGIYWMDRVDLLKVCAESYLIALGSYVVVLLVLAKILYDENYTKLVALTNVEGDMRSKEADFTKNFDAQIGK